MVPTERQLEYAESAFGSRPEHDELVFRAQPPRFLNAFLAAVDVTTGGVDAGQLDE
jgi:hypothetical protein